MNAQYFGGMVADCVAITPSPQSARPISGSFLQLQPQKQKPASPGRVLRLIATAERAGRLGHGLAAHPLSLTGALRSCHVALTAPSRVSSQISGRAVRNLPASDSIAATHAWLKCHASTFHRTRRSCPRRRRDKSPESNTDPCPRHQVHAVVLGSRETHPGVEVLSPPMSGVRPQLVNWLLGKRRIASPATYGPA
jgi:hypothetical protein